MPFSSTTTTTIFVQVSPLFEDAPLNSVELALAIEMAEGGDFGTVLTEELMPKSLPVVYSRFAEKFAGDPEFHPDSLPTMKFLSATDTPKNGLPLLWLRNQNIDIDSVWWNYFTEKGAGFNSNPTDLNDSYWHIDLKDPDINRIPGEDHTLLSDRFPDIDYAVEAVPYELIYPEWFTAHPEYVKTDQIFQALGIDIKHDILEDLRDDENSRDIDNCLFGSFIPLLPRNRANAEYVYKFFREMFKSRAFSSTTVQQTSPCVEYALSSAGLYKTTGELVGFINNQGNTLNQKKANNYYYEYLASSDSEVDLQKVLTFEDSKDQFNVTLGATEIIIRKVRGSILGVTNNKAIEVIAGKGATFPEFTHFKGSLYPQNPNIAPAFTPTELNNFDDNVTQPHIDTFAETEIPEKYPDAWIAIRVQKNPGKVKGNHLWDIETETPLNNDSSDMYYEEIIIVNPRIEYRGVYSTAFKSPRAYKALHAGTVFDFWVTSDNPNFRRWSNGAGDYEDKDAGTTFEDDGGDEQTSGNLLLPGYLPVLRQMKFQQYEKVLGQSLCIVNMAIKRTKTSWLKKNLGNILTLITVIFIVIPGINTALTALAELTKKELVAAIVKQYIKFKVIEYVAEQFVKLLAKEFGIEIAAQIVAVITTVATVKMIQNPALGTEDFMMLANNMDDAFVDYSQDVLKGKMELYDDNVKEHRKRMDALQREYVELLTEDTLGAAIRTLTFQILDEEPSEFFARVIEDKNPGVKTLDIQELRYTIYKTLTPKKPNIMVAELANDSEYLENLV